MLIPRTVSDSRMKARDSARHGSWFGSTRCIGWSDGNRCVG